MKSIQTKPISQTSVCDYINRISFSEGNWITSSLSFLGCGCGIALSRVPDISAFVWQGDVCKGDGFIHIIVAQECFLYSRRPDRDVQPSMQSCLIFFSGNDASILFWWLVEWTIGSIWANGYLLRLLPLKTQRLSNCQLRTRAPCQGTHNSFVSLFDRSDFLAVPKWSV